MLITIDDLSATIAGKSSDNNVTADTLSYVRNSPGIYTVSWAAGLFGKFFTWSIVLAAETIGENLLCGTAGSNGARDGSINVACYMSGLVVANFSQAWLQISGES